MFVFCFNWKTEGSHLVKISRFSKATRVSLVTLKFNLWFIILLFSTGYHGAIHPFLFCFIIARSQSVTSNRNAIHSLLTFWIATSEIKLRELTQLTKCVLPYCNYQSNCTNPTGCSPPCLPATSKTNLETSAPHALDWGRRKVCTILWGEGSLRTWEKSRKRKSSLVSFFTALLTFSPNLLSIRALDYQWCDLKSKQGLFSILVSLPNWGEGIQFCSTLSLPAPF